MAIFLLALIRCTVTIQMHRILGSHENIATKNFCWIHHVTRMVTSTWSTANTQQTYLHYITGIIYLYSHASPGPFRAPVEPMGQLPCKSTLLVTHIISKKQYNVWTAGTVCLLQRKCHQQSQYYYYQLGRHFLALNYRCTICTNTQPSNGLNHGNHVTVSAYEWISTYE